MISKKVIINRLYTGVPGLDEVLGGGLPEHSFNLIAGAPGSGKTTLAHQLMFGLATPDRPAIYFTALDEPPSKMLRYQQQFDFFNLDTLNRSIRLVNLADDSGADNLEKVLARIESEVEAHNPALVFVDSFRSVAIASQNNGNSLMSLQLFVQKLAMLMASWQATTFLIGEYLSENEMNPIFTVADGLIWLHQSVHRNSVVRKLEISKMRGQPSLPGLHTFRMSQAGIRVFAPAAPIISALTSQTSGTPTRLSMGNKDLDEMLGGGLPSGYSLLVAGPSGSGKSIMAEAFLREGALRGEIGVIDAFEQRADRSHGAEISELISTGKVGLIHTQSFDLSVDEIATSLMEEVQRLGAKRVVIDSISGFELALAPTFREDFREALSRLFTALSGTGATVLMTAELEDRYQDLRFSPYGSASSTDAIIVQRYIEVESQLQRVLAVVKVRGSAHSNDLRVYHIDDAGLQIGTRLADHEGLLGGRPTLRTHASSAASASA